MDVPVCFYWEKRLEQATQHCCPSQLCPTSRTTQHEPGLPVLTLGSNPSLLLTSCVPSDRTPCY